MSYNTSVLLRTSLCEVAMILFAMAGSSCTIATSDNAYGDGTAASPGVACDLSGGTSEARGIEERILSLVNAERQNAGCQPLKFSSELASAARDHNARMASDGFFDHRGEGERGLPDRIALAGTSADSVGENLFKASTPASDGIAQQCVGMWMQSDGHRRNLLSRDFDSTGVSVVYSKGECYITEDFARIGTAMHVAHRSSTRRGRLAARHLRPRHSSFRVAASRPRGGGTRHVRTSNIARNDKRALTL